MVRWVKSLKWLALGFMAASVSAGAQEQLTEGKDFLRLKQPQAVESGGDPRLHPQPRAPPQARHD